MKRFITNGDSDIHLVLARSEEGTKDGRGLSMFIYDKRQGGVNVRHIEHKLGIHGSPTCELTYKNAKAELCGSTRLGLIKYVMALMNGARLGIAAQSVGVEQEAYNEGLAYAKERQQFGEAIINFPAVYDMLSRMKAKLDAGRSLLYETAAYVDIYKCLEDIERDRKLTPEEKQELKKYQRLADAFTPLAKGMNSEYANQYDSVAGGCCYPLHHQRHDAEQHQGDDCKPADLRLHGWTEGPCGETDPRLRGGSCCCEGSRQSGRSGLPGPSSVRHDC